MTDEEIQKLLEENIALTKEVRDLSAKTAKYIRWMRISDIIKIILIALPLIAAWLYLPDILDFFTSGYGGIFPSGLMIK